VAVQLARAEQQQAPACPGMLSLHSIGCRSQDLSGLVLGKKVPPYPVITSAQKIKGGICLYYNLLQRLGNVKETILILVGQIGL
jgi:hypothetical protein